MSFTISLYKAYVLPHLEYCCPLLLGITKAQFRRRASAVPNLIVIRFDCSTAGKQL